MLNRNISNYFTFAWELFLVVLVWRAIWGLANYFFLETSSPIDYVVSLIVFAVYTIIFKRRIGF